MARRPSQKAEPSSQSLDVSACVPLSQGGRTNMYPHPRETATSSRGSLRTSAIPWLLGPAWPTRIVRPTVPVPQTTATTCAIPGRSSAGAASKLTSRLQISSTSPRDNFARMALTVGDLDPLLGDTQPPQHMRYERHPISRGRYPSQRQPGILEQRCGQRRKRRARRVR